jgi:hypothetical protein
VLICDDTADLAAYLGMPFDGDFTCTKQGCALDLAASEQHGTPIPKPALFLLANRRLAGIVDSITFRYRADDGQFSESLVWELIAVNDGSFSRNACPFYGERIRWGNSTDSFHRCDCKNPILWC